MENTPAKDKKMNLPAPNRKNLGKGLSALLGDIKEESNGVGLSRNPGNRESAAPVGPPVSPVQLIPVDQIEVNPYQPRTEFDQEALQELADSITALGIITPITVRRLSEGSYQLIAGERRLQASKRAGLTELPAYIRTANDEQMMSMALIENIQRQDLNPLEEALGYKRLMDEFALVIEDVAQKVGKKRPTINNYLRLLKLPPELQLGLKVGQLTMGHARALINVDNPLIQLNIYQEILEKGLSVREVEDRVRTIGQPKPQKEAAPKAARPDSHSLHLRDQEKKLTATYGTKVEIAAKADGSGELRLRYYSADDLNRLLELLERE